MHIPPDTPQGAPGLAPPVRVHTLPISTVGSSLGFVNWKYPFIQLVGKFRAFFSVSSLRPATVRT